MSKQHSERITLNKIKNMNNIKKMTLALAFTTIGFVAQAQKSFTEGATTYNLTSEGQQSEAKIFFKGDSSSYQFQVGPANIKLLSGNKANFMAILVEVPVASMKKVAVYTPADMEKMKDREPSFTSTPTSETQTIAGYNCKKVIVKDSKNNLTFDVWVTNDISAPSNTFTKYFTDINGFPVKFTTLVQGKKTDVLLKSISAEKVKPGTFTIPADFDRITLTELMSMGGGQ